MGHLNMPELIHHYDNNPLFVFQLEKLSHLVKTDAICSFVVGVNKFVFPVVLKYSS